MSDPDYFALAVTLAAVRAGVAVPDLERDEPEPELCIAPGCAEPVTVEHAPYCSTYCCLRAARS